MDRIISVRNGNVYGNILVGWCPTRRAVLLTLDQVASICRIVGHNISATINKIPGLETGDRTLTLKNGPRAHVLLVKVDGSGAIIMGPNTDLKSVVEWLSTFCAMRLKWQCVEVPQMAA